ncbi:heavy metal efflux pump, RND family, inner membrane protein, CzcA family [Geotalea daltonii FRC-32]|uniref:Heavy metal efflux pump, RND family, inner membrane protein, CzcA family n=1 Tax=Geotalea daltonii (strain DSM 22248 / JCM 15807 / FRC-32) TaxID=316067 RepID=B9M7J7_GEODF|nr:efflux RND transporter permease subunit [Geotalea daltonii]ACM22103.1 heavy metal efflux pump, RND family, inner membrane protein, CzcA family [Geotalea daltonii FRC-32]
MLDKVIRLALENRLIVVVASLLVLLVGTYITMKMPVDVLPDLTAPTVTIITEAHGMATEEVESVVTYPIESAVNGSSGVRRVRSYTVAGLSTVWVEFTWGTDIYKARQVVNEKLQSLAGVLPADAIPQLAPISSIMGEIMHVALVSDKHNTMELKETADFVIRKRLLAVPGVSQVSNIGGDTRQYQAVLDPQRLQAFGVTVGQVITALKGANENFAAGVMKKTGQEYMIRGVGRVRTTADLEQVVVTARGGVPVLVRDVARVAIGPAFRYGDASANGKPGVVISIQKHPTANTLELTKRLEGKLAELQKSLPAGMKLETDIFRQSDFIERAIDNIKKVLTEGALLVIVILFLFLGNVRTTLISITAMPLSLLFAIFALRIFDISINTMTLGGMAIAIGVIVDDAIIDVENVFRRLQENRLKPESTRSPSRMVIFEASKEIRASIVNATMIILMVFMPLFFLTGVEGRLLRPLGISYMVSIGASLIVALTVTPALCSYLLPRAKCLEREEESAAVRWLQRLYRPMLNLAISRPKLVIAGSVAAFVLAMIPLSMTGRSFLPAFNEGALTVVIVTSAGTSLEQSAAIALEVEKKLLAHPNIKKTARRTGRGDMDEHGKAASMTEIEAKLDMKDRKLGDVMAEVRKSMAGMPATITFGQPIGHRIDHMLSGTMANLAIKVYGPELYRLRITAEEIRGAIADVTGLADLSVEQQKDIPQVRIIPDRAQMARYDLTMSGVAEAMEAATAGMAVTRTLEGDRGFDVVVKFPDAARDSTGSIENVMIDTPTGVKIPLSTVARVVSAKGPNTITRENAQRKIVVQANVAGRDLRSVFEDVRSNIEQKVKLPEGYYVEYGGQFESEAEATRTIGLLSIVSLLFIILILYIEFRCFRDAFLVMVNLPLAFIGGIIAVYFTSRVISVASLVGFITLFGIATRNGILLISHYKHLMEQDGKTLQEAVLQGSMERLRPVIMTALAAGLALVPFAIAADKPGNEILSPLAIVILGGLLSSTVLNMVVLPSLYLKFGKEQQK